jgi:hypothetical protein
VVISIDGHLATLPASWVQPAALLQSAAGDFSEMSAASGSDPDEFSRAFEPDFSSTKSLGRSTSVVSCLDPDASGSAHGELTLCASSSPSPADPGVPSHLDTEISADPATRTERVRSGWTLAATAGGSLMHTVSGATTEPTELLGDHPPRPQGGPPSFIGPIPLAAGGSNCQLPPASTPSPSQATTAKSENVDGTQPEPTGPAQPPKPASPHQYLGEPVPGALECLPPPSQTEQASPHSTTDTQPSVAGTRRQPVCLSENLSQQPSTETRTSTDLVPHEKEVKSSLEHPLHRDTTREIFV